MSLEPIFSGDTSIPTIRRWIAGDYVKTHLNLLGDKKIMNIRHKFSVVLVAAGIMVSSVSCASTLAPVLEADVAEMVAVEQPQILAPDVHLGFSRSEVTTIAGPPKLAPVRKESAPVKTVEPAPAVPVVTVPRVVESVTASVVSSGPVFDREVYVNLAGGQSVVDMARGPVLFPLGGGFPPYVVEHDWAGGWQRFGTLRSGMTVKMSGLVSGTYTVGQTINVPKGASTDDFYQFGTMPRVLLQTCIPGTNRMIVVGLY